MENIKIVKYLLFSILVHLFMTYVLINTTVPTPESYEYINLELVENQIIKNNETHFSKKNQKTSLVKSRFRTLKKLKTNKKTTVKTSAHATYKKNLTSSVSIEYFDSEVYENDQNFIFPAVIQKEKPIYPKNEIQKRVEGHVISKIFINSKGFVDKVEIVKSISPDLDNAVRKALENTTFTAALFKGKKVASIIQYRHRFKINK